LAVAAIVSAAVARLPLLLFQQWRTEQKCRPGRWS